MGGRVVLGGRIGHGCEGWLFVLSDEMVFKHLDIVQLGQSLTLKLVYTTTHPPTHHKLFSQKGLCYDFEILHRVNTHKKNKIWGEKKFGVPPQPPWWLNF